MFTASWKKGTESFHKADAQKVAMEIMALGDDVSPQQLVDAARDEHTELHKCFTWDDTIAAAKWRKHEARLVFCHLVINNDGKDETKPEIRVFHKVESGKGYEPAPLVFKVDDEYQKLLQAAYAELRRFKIKYGSLQELEYITSLID